MQDYNIEYLTAAEIDNIVLLKDAAATAIYGLKGANGVIVINTKSGLPGTFDVRVTADFSLQQIARKPEKTSSYEYASLRNQAWENDGSVGAAPFSADQMARIRSGNDPLYPDNDYYNNFVRNFGTMERLGVSLSRLQSAHARLVEHQLHEPDFAPEAGDRRVRGRSRAAFG